MDGYDRDQRTEMAEGLGVQVGTLRTEATEHRGEQIISGESDHSTYQWSGWWIYQYHHLMSVVRVTLPLPIQL